MQRYIKQLIEDIQKATPDIDPAIEFKDNSVHDDETFFKHIENVEKFLYDEGEYISTITGIDFNLLPPPEKLTTAQKEILATELEKLLEYFHFELDFPVNYPVPLRYPFIKKFWEEKHAALSFGTSHIEFCSYEEENCPFPGYCKTCEEVTAQMKFDEEQAKGTDNDETSFPSTRDTRE